MVLITLIINTGFVFNFCSNPKHYEVISGEGDTGKGIREMRPKMKGIREMRKIQGCGIWGLYILKIYNQFINRPIYYKNDSSTVKPLNVRIKLFIQFALNWDCTSQSLCMPEMGLYQSSTSEARRIAVETVSGLTASAAFRIFSWFTGAGLMMKLTRPNS